MNPYIKIVGGQQWSNLAAQKLSKEGEQILYWMEDAASCFPGQRRDNLEERERVIVSDLLRCAREENIRDIGGACIEFARRHTLSPDILLRYVEPLVFSQPAVRNFSSFSPWQVKDGKLKLSRMWYFVQSGWQSGLPYHFKILEQPIPKEPRANVEAFKGQIVNETSQWRTKT
jgi:hypothetical protein